MEHPLIHSASDGERPPWLDHELELTFMLKTVAGMEFFAPLNNKNHRYGEQIDRATFE
jgi:hypothetical protein